MSDLLFQNISTVQSLQQPKPVTIASAATVAPTTFLSFVSGTVQIATITPPVTGAHLLAFVYTTTTPTTTLTTGNIAKAVTPTSGIPVFLAYDPLTAKYYPGSLGTTGA
jgi:hypothetical protein